MDRASFLRPHRDLARFDLKLAAIENFAVRHWYDILLDGLKRAQQMAQLKAIMRRSGVPCMAIISLP